MCVFSFLLLASNNEAERIRHNDLKLVDIICIDCSDVNITVLFFCQVFDERISLYFFLTVNYVSGLGKYYQIEYYIKYFMNTRISILLINDP